MQHTGHFFFRLFHDIINGNLLIFSVYIPQALFIELPSVIQAFIFIPEISISVLFRIIIHDVVHVIFEIAVDNAIRS